MDGQWKLVYTSNSELFGLLALSRLPFVSVGDITQKIEASTFTVENKVRLNCSFAAMHCQYLRRALSNLYPKKGSMFLGHASLAVQQQVRKSVFLWLRITFDILCAGAIDGTLLSHILQHNSFL